METKKKLNEVAIMQRLSDGELTHVVGGVIGVYFVQWCPVADNPASWHYIAAMPIGCTGMQ